MSRLTTITAIAIAVVLTAGLSIAATERRASSRPTWNDDRLLTILVIGSDWGPPRPGNPLRGRADAIHIIAVDTKRKRVTIVDIPRDSQIGGTKVNAHLSRGGPAALKGALQRYTDVKFDYYVLTSFRGMRTMVSGMGGIPIKLRRPIRDSASRAKLKAGHQTLDGFDALAFSRARKTIPGGDFGRTRHQGELLRAAHRELRSRKLDLVSLTRLVGVFARNTATDIPHSELFRIATLAMSIKPGGVRQVPLSGGTGFAGASSVVNLRTGSVFADIRRGRVGR